MEGVLFMEKGKNTVTGVEAIQENGTNTSNKEGTASREDTASGEDAANKVILAVRVSLKAV